MNCPVCNTVNPDTQRFCLQCGARLTSAIPSIPPVSQAGPAQLPPVSLPTIPPPVPQPEVVPHPVAATPPLIPASQQETPGLANAARWTGIGSIGLMALALVVMLLGVLTRSSPMTGLALLMGLPGLLAGPLAFLFGMLALIDQDVGKTVAGRRHAIIGLTTGVSTLLLCCALALLLPSNGSS